MSTRPSLAISSSHRPARAAPAPLRLARAAAPCWSFLSRSRRPQSSPPVHSPAAPAAPHEQFPDVLPRHDDRVPEHQGSTRILGGSGGGNATSPASAQERDLADTRPFLQPPGSVKGILHQGLREAL